MTEDEVPKALLEPAAALWSQLSSAVYRARVAGDACATNDELRKRVDAEQAGDFTPAYLMWLGDNLTAGKRLDEAAKVYAEHADRFGDRRLNDGLWRPVAMEALAIAQERSGRPKDAIVTYSAALDGPTDGHSRAWLALQAARVAENTLGDAGLATQWYDRAVEETDAAPVFEIPVAELAKRDAVRLRGDHPWVHSSPTELAAKLAAAIRKSDAVALRALASETHMRVGVAGSEVRFVDAVQTVDLLVQRFGDGGALCDPGSLEGNGDKRYLAVAPAKPASPYTVMHLLLCRCSLGWEWAGVVWTVPDDALSTLLPPPVPLTNNPLPNRFFKSPWPAGVSFHAGGVLNFGAEAFAVSILPGGWLAALAMSNGPAGWGPAGYYYNQFSHSGAEQAFAIDFTRYRRGVPLVNAAGGTPVLSVSSGVVSMVRKDIASGDPTQDNRVEVNYVTATSEWSVATLSGMAPTRLRAKYLHLAGPGRVPVSVGMSAPRGVVLGFMDDTGLSAFDHLHFSVHDRDMGFQSVRITPLDGQTLEDGNNYRVVSSTNVPGRG